MKIAYDDYYDKVLGGWIGKCIGGTIGDRFEGDKRFIEVERDSMFPPEVPPNDDLDLQVLWLKVLEEKGADLTSEDLADAWLEGCWYPFNEYGIFRRNYRLGIAPPVSGRFGNRFWDTGMGCPIRAEIWGYALPGAPDIAARFAEIDGVLDHTEQSVGAERMFAAMASMAFFVDDWRVLAERFMHHLPAGTPVERLTRAAFRAHADGLTLAEARERVLLLAGTPEACDCQINVPFTFLGLLYGENDLLGTVLAALKCGYDTDCTMATGGALIGQVIGAKAISQALKDKIGDELVMGIEYRRPEMTISALARDTARVGVLLGEALSTGLEVTGAPELEPLPPRVPSGPSVSIAYSGPPSAAPGDELEIVATVAGSPPADAELRIDAPPGWSVSPIPPPSVEGETRLRLRAVGDGELWPQRNLFEARLESRGETLATRRFGISGAGLWRLLHVGYDAVPDADSSVEMESSTKQRCFNHHFIDPDKHYLPEPPTDLDGPYRRMSRILGRPAVVASHEHEIDLSGLIGLSGVYSAYLAREFVVERSRRVYLVLGHTDAYRLWLNGEQIADVAESSAWTPFNRHVKATLRAGRNTLVVKLVKRTDHLHFTLGLRLCSEASEQARDFRWSMNAEDWLIDTADVIPD